jgi:hypothetical protein
VAAIHNTAQTIGKHILMVVIPRFMVLNGVARRPLGDILVQPALPCKPAK